MIWNKYFVSGVTRGIGKGVVDHLLKNKVPVKNIYVGVRDPAKLEKISFANNLSLDKKNILEFDLENFDSFDNLIQELNSRNTKVYIQLTLS